MAKAHGPWQIVSSRQVYRDPWVELTRDEVVRPDGALGSHCVVRMKAGVSVLALDEDRTAYLIEEFHYAVGRVTLEVVSGGRDEDEDPLAAAQRELAEEIGATAGKWTPLGVIDPFTSVVVSPTHLYLAEKLTFGPTRLEGTELIQCRPLALEEAVHGVLDGRITHGPSCVAILKASLLLAGV